MAPHEVDAVVLVVVTGVAVVVLHLGEPPVGVVGQGEDVVVLGDEEPLEAERAEVLAVVQRL